MRSTVVFPVLLVIAAASRLPGDEGMWLLNRLPVERLGEEHGFRPDDAWARRVMRCCVRISRGGSGSVISSDGLVLTNHHVASGILQDLSTRELDIMDKGFLARSREEELRCPGTEIVILREIRDVTARVQGAVAPGMDAAAAEKARRARIA
ncbi:MAG: S46 family peptidase, partial [Planctomycetes bacterium]|nr:S46 family peptidase [Planctomycetota bacterium]